MTSLGSYDGFAPARFAGATPTPFDCELLVPRECHPAQPVGASARVAALARFESNDLVLELGATLTPREVDLGDFAAFEAESASQRVVQTRAWAEGALRNVEIFCEPQGASSPIERHRLIKNGSSIVRLVTRFADSTSSWALQAAIACGSLRRLNPCDDAHAEPLVRWEGAETPGWSLEFPQSWRPLGERANTAEPLLLVHELEGRAGGELYVTVEKDTDPSAQTRSIRRFAERLRAAGVELSGAPISPLAGKEGVLTYSPAAEYAGGDLCVAAVAERSAGWVTCIGVRGPARTVAPFVWAVNKRAFEIARETLRTQPA